MSFDSVSSTPVAGTKRPRPTSPRASSPLKRRKSTPIDDHGSRVDETSEPAGAQTGKGSERATSRSNAILELTADEVLSYLSTCTAEDLLNFDEDSQDETTQYRNHWHPMLVHSAQCAGILDQRKRFTKGALEDMHRTHARRKAIIVIAISCLATGDIAGIYGLWHDVFTLFDLTGSTGNDWQVELAQTVLVLAKNKSVDTHQGRPVLLEGNTMQSLEDRLRQLAGGSLSEPTQRLLDGCAQSQRAFLEAEQQGKLDEFEDSERRRSVSLLCTHMSNVICYVDPHLLIPDADEEVSAINERDAVDLEAMHESPELSTEVERNDDPYYQDFERRIQQAVEMQSSEQQDQILASLDTEQPSPRGDNIAHPNVSVESEQNKPSQLPLHQPTPVKQPVRPPELSNAIAPAASNPAQTLRESYDNARLAAHTRAFNSKKRPPSPAHTSNRKVWSIEEENALLEGLEILQGPHWRDILSLYGENGTKSEVLKNRSQVQLKDKARNMKLFYKKNGLEAPEVLQKVTGELKPPRAKLPEEARVEETRSPVVPVETQSPVAPVEETQTQMAPVAVMTETRQATPLQEDSEALEEVQSPEHAGLGELAATIAT